MIGRFIKGLIVGTLLGALVAAAVTWGLGLVVAGAFLAYLTAAAVGGIAGLLLGKPIWAKEAKIEGGLKALFGGLVGAVVMFAIRTWLAYEIDLTFLVPAAKGLVGELPLASLPIVAGVLGSLFELDNTPSSDDRNGEKKLRAKRAAQVRVEPDREAEDEEEAASQARSKARR